jgi:hypothetical protein
MAETSYGEDWTGATRKYKILAETTDKYVVEPFDTIDKIGIRLIDKSKIRMVGNDRTTKESLGIQRGKRFPK